MTNKSETESKSVKTPAPEWEKNWTPRFRVGEKVEREDGLRDGSSMLFTGEVLRTLPGKRYLVRWHDSTSGAYPSDPEPNAESRLRRAR